MATGQVYGRWRILTSYRIETPEPTVTKFGTIDYFHEMTPPEPNLVQISIHWGLLDKRFVPFLFIYTFFLILAYRFRLRRIWGL